MVRIRYYRRSLRQRKLSPTSVRTLLRPSRDEDRCPCLGLNSPEQKGCIDRDHFSQADPSQCRVTSHRQAGPPARNSSVPAMSACDGLDTAAAIGRADGLQRSGLRALHRRIQRASWEWEVGDRSRVPVESFPTIFSSGRALSSR
jgi:hypothetical protein